MELIRSSRRRDLRVDFFRGLALWWIYTDHIPGDVLGDYSLRKAYATAFGKRKLPSPEALAKAGEKWRPYRTVASWYLWQTLNRT